MTKEVPQWSFVAQVSYLSSADTTVADDRGADHPSGARSGEGLRNVFFQVEGPVTQVTLRGSGPGGAGVHRPGQHRSPTRPGYEGAAVPAPDVAGAVGVALWDGAPAAR